MQHQFRRGMRTGSLLVAGLLVLATAVEARSPTTMLVSINPAGTASGTGEANQPVVSADGRFVAFTDTNGGVFVRDLKTETTTLVSINRAGTNGGNGFSFSPVMSANGRFVAFVSFASDLVATDITQPSFV